jgi:hypothetical protein
MMDPMTYEVAPVENIGWMSEAHRLSLGADRSRKGPTTARNTNRSSEIALATRPRITRSYQIGHAAVHRSRLAAARGKMYHV